MDDISRRRMLAATGSALSVALAGCALDVPAEESSAQSTPPDTDFGDFPDEFETPARNFDDSALESDLSAVYRDVVESVTAVEIETAEGQAGGTAWVYEDSYLVTNEHVIADGRNPYLWFTDIGWREAEVVGTDRHSDLAVLEARNKPESATPLPTVDEPRAVGTSVAAVGNPFGLTGSFTTGVISGRNRTIPIPGSDFSIADGIQTDAALNPGNSGGPLITFDGEVVGIVSAGRGENIGYAISAAMVENVVPELIEDGEYEHSHLGVRLADVRPALIEANELPVSWGVYIHEVVEGGPSDGNLQGSDREEVVDGRNVWIGGDVIVRMDDWTIQDRERLSAFLALETDPGDTIEIEIVRDGDRDVVDVTVGSRPDLDG